MNDRHYAELSLEFNRHIVNLLDSLSALSELAQLSIHDMDEPGLLKQALAALMANQDMERCSIFLLDQENMLTNAAGLDWEEMLGNVSPMLELASERPRTRYRIGDGIMGLAAAEGKLIHCSSCADDPRFKRFHAPSLQGSLLCVPIVCEGRVHGVLNIFHPTANFFNMWHERLLQLFCQSLGRMLANHRLTAHLNKLVAAKTVEISRQNSFLQSILDSAPDPIMVIGHDYRILTANRAACPSLSPDARCHAISHHRDTPCDGAEHRCPLREVLDHEQVVRVVHEHYDAAGAPRQIELLASPLRNEDGTVIGIIESARDITDRVRIENELKKVGQRLQEAQRIAHIGSWERDFATDKMSCSAEMRHIIGPTHCIDCGNCHFAALVGAIHPEDRTEFIHGYETSIALRRPFELTHRILQPDGMVSYVHTHCETLHGKDGKPTTSLGTMQDVTLNVLSEMSLKESEERFRTIADYTYDWEYWEGPRGEMLYCSPSCQELTGHGVDDFVARPSLLYDIIHPDDRALMDAHHRDVRHEHAGSINFRIVRRDGEIRWIAHGCRGVRDPSGRFMGRRASNRDITELKRVELEYQAILLTATDGFLLIDHQGRFIDCNNAYCTMSGYGRDELLRMHASDIDANETPSDVRDHLQRIREQGHDRFETRHRRKDGGVFDVEVSVAYLDIGGGKLVAFIRDISERKNTEEQIRQLAYYDTLTGLPNRRLLVDRLDHALAQARRFHRSLAVMFLDLDRFKLINDTLGHSSGDELLRQVATRLAACVREGDTVARPGGDEFVIVLTEVAQPQDAAGVARKVITAFDAPFPVAGQELRVTTSIGIAIYPIDGADDVDELMKKADMAMYRAKEAGRNGYRFYEEDAAG